MGEESSTAKRSKRLLVVFNAHLSQRVHVYCRCSFVLFQILQMTPDEQEWYKEYVNYYNSPTATVPAWVSISLTAVCYAAVSLDVQVYTVLLVSYM